MTDIEMRQQGAIVPDQSAAPGTDLILWARQAEAAAMYAERVCSTTMAPAAYRGKPAEAAAAILAGAELGFSPMASLRAFDNISGTPAPKAMTLRAVVQAAGHEVVIEESSNERAVVSGRRKGTDQWQTSVWDVPRAQQLAQFKSNAMYKTNLAQMLCARATAEVCRWVGADAIMGMPYAAEEIDDIPAVTAPAVRRLTAADLGGEHTVRLPAAEVRKLTGGELDQPVDLPAPPEMVSDQQRKRMFALWRDLGYDGDENREQRLEITAKILGLPALDSSNELTHDEAERVIAALIERKSRTAGGAE